jgi:hypothetical protein
MKLTEHGLIHDEEEEEEDDDDDDDDDDDGRRLTLRKEYWI